MSQQPKTPPADQPENQLDASIYVGVISSATRYLGIASLLATGFFFYHWNNPNWSEPWALIFWLWFIIFNVFWSRLVREASHRIRQLENIRIWTNYLNITILFHLTGGAAENFWFPAAVCALGSSTSMFWASGKIGGYAIGSLVLYLVLFLADTHMEKHEVLELVPVVLIMAPVFAISLRTAQEMRQHYSNWVAEQQRVLQVELERQRAVADSEAKSLFLASMNHEIRTPLTAIEGFTELLRAEGLDEEKRRLYLETVQRNVAHLKTLVQDILSWEKIQSGESSVELEPVDVRYEIDAVVRSMELGANKKGVSLRTVVSPDVPARMETDVTNLRQILLNLLSNAIKFTDSGSIFVAVTGQARQDGKAVVTVTVTDTGSGIPADKHEFIFGAFKQLSRPQAASGTGLGLSLSRMLARQLGGDLKLVASEPGHGSTFEFQIAGRICDPMARPAKSVDVDDYPLLVSRRILVVEDNPDTRALVTTILEGAGAKVQAVHDGLAALERLASESFDAILMDLEMPKMNGYTAIEKIKAREIATPIVVFTANALSDVKSRVEGLGVDGFLTKPASGAAILAAMEGVMTPPVGKHHPEHSPHHPERGPS